MQQNMYISYKGKLIPTKCAKQENLVRVTKENMELKPKKQELSDALEYIEKIRKEFNCFRKSPSYTADDFKEFLKNIKKEIKSKQ